nr:PREDICTED: uncharacterized protein LOC100880120 isoform X1 [Megachile rotundata]
MAARKPIKDSRCGNEKIGVVFSWKRLGNFNVSSQQVSPDKGDRKDERVGYRIRGFIMEPIEFAETLRSSCKINRRNTVISRTPVSGAADCQRNFDSSGVSPFNLEVRRACSRGNWPERIDQMALDRSAGLHKVPEDLDTRQRSICDGVSGATEEFWWSSCPVLRCQPPERTFRFHTDKEEERQRETSATHTRPLKEKSASGAFSLTKTATGILFKFSNIDDFQAVYKKGFHKVTGARFYKKVAIPCRPAKTFTVYVLDVPEELPEEDIRHALYKYRSIVEVTRLPLNTATALKAINDKLKSEAQNQHEPATIYTGPPVIRVTLASVEETSLLLSRGLDFYGATYFPTETPHPAAQPLAKYKNNRWLELAAIGAGQRVRDLLPVFDNAGFNKLPPPASRLIKPQKN